MTVKRLLKKSVNGTLNRLGYQIVPVEDYDVQTREAFRPNPNIPEPFASLSLGGETLHQLLHFHDFRTVLDVGSGAGLHAKIMREYGKSVTELDFGKSVYYEQREGSEGTIFYGDFMSYSPGYKYDCIWASHVLEHQPNPGLFLDRCINLVREGGVIAITVPPFKHEIVGGHLSLWNAGMLLYQLVFAGLDCRTASVRSYGYNVSVIVNNVRRPDVDLDYDSGDIDRLSKYFPGGIREGFDGRISHLNWQDCGAVE